MDERQQQTVNEAAEKFTEALVDSYRAVSDRAVSGQERNAELAQRFFNGVISNLYAETENNRHASRDLAEQTRRGQEATQTLMQESISAYTGFLNSLFSYSQRGTEEAAERNVRQAEASIQQAQAGAQAGAQASAEVAQAGAEAGAEAAQAGTQATGNAAGVEAEPVTSEPVTAETAPPETTAPEITTPEPGASESIEARGEELPIEGYDSMNVRQISERLDEHSAEEIRRLRDYEARNKNRQTLLNRFDQRLQAASS